MARLKTLVLALMLALECTGAQRYSFVDAGGAHSYFGPKSSFVAVTRIGERVDERSDVRSAGAALEASEIDKLTSAVETRAPAVPVARAPLPEPLPAAALSLPPPLSADERPVVPFHLDSKR